MRSQVTRAIEKKGFVFQDKFETKRHAYNRFQRRKVVRKYDWKPQINKKLK